MNLIDKYPEHAELILLGDHCIWCWECYWLASQYCNETKLDDWHQIDNMLTIILKEYYYLQTAKLHDRVTIGENDNHTIKYVIERMPENNGLLDIFETFRKNNWTFIKSIKHARNKTIAHNDAAKIHHGIRYASYPEGADIKYFKELHDLLDQLYKAAGLNLFVDWPDMTKYDISSFISVLLESKKC